MTIVTYSYSRQFIPIGIYYYPICDKKNEYELTRITIKN